MEKGFNEVSIIINGVRYDAVDFPYKSAPNKCESCEDFILKLLLANKIIQMTQQ